MKGRQTEVLHVHFDGASMGIGEMRNRRSRGTVIAELRWDSVTSCGTPGGWRMGVHDFGGSVRLRLNEWKVALAARAGLVAMGKPTWGYS